MLCRFLMGKRICWSVGLLILIVLFTGFIGTAVYFTATRNPMILVVSFDGFRYDYINEFTPTLSSLRKKGVYSDFMRNVFITKTFPNHHSIATGLFPETHGVLASSIYDSNREEVISYSDRLWRYNDYVMPLWTLTEKVGHHSGVFMWPGGEFEYNGTMPTFKIHFNNTVDWADRVDTVFRWFTHPETPASVVFLYFEEPDRTSHYNSPDSKKVLDQIVKCDNITRYMLRCLSDYGLENMLDIFFLSDHGMTSVTSDKVINITQYVEKSKYITASTSPALHIIPKLGEFEDVYNALNAASQIENFTVYSKDELFDRWHYKCDRTPPILLLADIGFVFDDIFQYGDSEVREHNMVTFGVHGYDNKEREMHSFFIATGPSLRSNYKIAPFDSVDLYSLFCKILNIEGPKTNGSLANIKDMLIDDNSLKIHMKWIFLACGAIMLIAIILIGIYFVNKNGANSFLQDEVCQFQQLRAQSHEEEHLLNVSDVEE